MQDHERNEPLAESLVDEVIAAHPDRTGDILNMLEALQERHPHKFLPRETLALVARKTGVALAQIWSVVTFYAFFNLEPQGLHSICVCRGTACHTRGSKPLYEALCRATGAKPLAPDDDRATESYTTPDHRLTVRTVACFGQCAMAPVVAVDETMHGHVSEPALKVLLAGLAAEESP